MFGLQLRCPDCEEMGNLSFADWEVFPGIMEPGKPERFMFECDNCHQEFLMEARLGRVVREDKARKRRAMELPQGLR